MREADQWIARRSYPKAIELLRAAAAERPAESGIRLRLAEALAAHGQGNETSEAVTLLDEVARELATQGFTAKAIAVYKRLQRLRPDAGTIERRLADLIRQREGELRAAGGSRPNPGVRGPGAQTVAPTVPAAPDAPAAPTASATSPATASPGAESDALPSGVVGSPLFSSFSRDELIEVLHSLQLRTFHPGEIVVSEGEPGDSLFVLASGEARVYVEGFDRRDRAVRTLAAGDFFGEISLLSGGVRTATVIAAAELELLELSRGAVVAIAARHPSVRQTLQKFCLDRAESPEERDARGPAGVEPAWTVDAEALDFGGDVPAPRLEPAEIAALLPYCSVRAFEPGETIFRRGDAGTELFVVEQGEVEVRFEHGRPAKRLQPGEIFGELALLTPGHQRTAATVAASETRLIAVDREAYARLREARPGVLVELLERSCAYLVDSEQRLVIDLKRRNRDLERVLEFLQRTKEELSTTEALAQTDELTGIFNRRCFEEQIRRLVERSNEGGLALALVVVDVDRFKRVNDTAGHLVGDLVLRKLAQLLRSSVRWTDLPCRIGGDEFAILWTDVDERSAARRAQSMLPALATFDLEGGASPLRITASLGGALHRAGESWEELFARADRGLYQAKKAGRGLLAWNEELLAAPLSA
jgi:diguanylate cyclase (GGDEF)-like protein